MMPYATAESALWGFFETFNAKSAAGRAGAMSYPHVRISAGRSEPAVTETAAEYEAQSSWDAVERAGWVRTQPMTPRVVHHQSDKVHFAGGWRRLREDGSVISRDRLLYVAARPESGKRDDWGIHAAFGIDGELVGEDAEAPSRAALDTIERTMAALEAGDADAWLDCFHYPLTMILGPCQHEIYASKEAMSAAYGPYADQAMPIRHESRVTAAASSAALVEQDIEHGPMSFQQVFLASERDGVWKVQAVSAVRPGE